MKKEFGWAIRTDFLAIDENIHSFFFALENIEHPVSIDGNIRQRNKGITFVSRGISAWSST